MSDAVEPRLRTGDRLYDWVIDELVQVGDTTRYLAHRGHDADEQALIEMAPRDARAGLRLRREAYAIRHFEHPNLPRLLDKGEHDQGRQYWVATRWFEADKLADVARDNPLAWSDVCAVFHQLAEALSHAHQHGVVHRDINPAKVEVDSRLGARLVGFELAMTDDELERSERPPLGDLAYVAPEVLADRRSHAPRADLYALGVVLFEVLTHQRAFPAASWGERADPEARMIEMKSRVTALDPGPDFPTWLRNLVRKATDPDPERRLPDPESLVGWLDAARDSWATPVPPTRREEPSVALPPPALLLAAPQFAAPNHASHHAASYAPSAAGRRPTAIADAPPNPLPLAFVYLASGTLGMVAGLAIGVFVLFLVTQRAV
jgi:serine/threonine protein kinase